MAELSSAVNELIKGKRVSENLPVYTGGLFSLYKRMAYLRMSLNYYTFSEIYYELSKDKKEVIFEEVAALQKLINGIILSNEMDYKSAEEEIIKLRNSIIGKMEVLTAFTDRIQIYEYILNRVEFRFNESEFDDKYYKNNFERDILNYVINERDNAVINMKLAMVMGELPMRLTKNKFFDIINQSFSIYKESEKLSINDFAYRIRTAGTIYTPVGMDIHFPLLNAYLNDFSVVDYSTITEEHFNLMRDKMDRAGELATEYADAFVMLTEVINDVYSIILCRNALYDSNETDKLVDIIAQSYKVVQGYNEPDLEWAEKFVDFEGLQEKIGNLIFTPESTMDEILNINRSVIEYLNATDDFVRLNKISRLQSTSTFAPLEEDAAMKEIADEKYITDIVDGLVKDFSEVFENCTQYYRRAVMAAVISNLPAYFNNMDEFKSYVHVALSQCNDESEKKACMTLINMMISSE